MFRIIDSIVLLLVLIACSISDIKYRKVKDMFIITGILLRPALFILFKENGKELIYNTITAIVVVTLLIGVLLICEKIFKKQLMGGADIKLIFMCGFYIGADKLLYVLFCSFFFTLIAGVFWTIKKRNIKIPYVPFLTLSVFLVLLPSSVEGNYLTGQIVGGL